MVYGGIPCSSQPEVLLAEKTYKWSAWGFVTQLAGTAMFEGVLISSIGKLIRVFVTEFSIQILFT